MAIRCTKCNNNLPGKSLHLVTKCPICGNTAKDLFIRVDDEDINQAKQQKDQEWLEAHKRNS